MIDDPTDQRAKVHSRRIPVARATFSLTDRDAFESAVHLSLAWIGSTISAELRRDPEPETREITGARGTASTIQMVDDQGSVWASRVEFLGDGIPGRRWTTELFVERRQGSFARFGAQLSCECSVNDPGFEHSRPRIVRNILSKLAAEADGESLTDSVTQVREEDVLDFVDLLYKPTRRLPVLLISIDDHGGSQVDVEQVANRLSGTAHLRTITPAASFALSDLLGKRMSTFNCAVRAYMPGLDRETENPYQHPLWLAPRAGRNSRLLRDIASRILPLGFRDSEGDARFWRVGLLRQTASRILADRANGSPEERLHAEIRALRDELDTAKDTATTAEALMYEASTKLNEALESNERLEKENDSLRDIIGSTGSASAGSAGLSELDVRAIFDHTPSLETSLRVIERMFPERVIVLDSAYESARDSETFIHRKKAFDLLWILSTSYWRSLAMGEGDVKARQPFGNSYAAKESGTLSSAGRKRRTFIVDGNPIEMFKHLKIGVKDSRSETLRVHFEWLAESKRVIIGHCGGHLDF